MKEPEFTATTTVLKIGDYAKLITEQAKKYYDAVTAYDEALLIDDNDDLIYDASCDKQDTEQTLRELFDYYNKSFST